MGVIFGLFMGGNSFPYSKMLFEAKSARALSTFRHLCAFLFMYNYTFSPSNGWCWVSFSGFFSGEFIYKLKNTIECKKCARTQGLLGTYAHFYMKLTLFLDIMFDGKLVLVQIKVRSRKLSYINAQSKDI